MINMPSFLNSLLFMSDLLAPPPHAESPNFSYKTFAPSFPPLPSNFFFLIYSEVFPPRKTKRIAKISIFDIARKKSDACVCHGALAPACNGASPTTSVANKSSNLGRRQIAREVDQLSADYAQRVVSPGAKAAVRGGRRGPFPFASHRIGNNALFTHCCFPQMPRGGGI